MLAMAVRYRGLVLGTSMKVAVVRIRTRSSASTTEHSVLSNLRPPCTKLASAAIGERSLRTARQPDLLDSRSSATWSATTASLGVVAPTPGRRRTRHEPAHSRSWREFCTRHGKHARLAFVNVQETARMTK
jgi:hypothetical protein